MSALKMTPGGAIALPRRVQKRYGFTAKTPIRVIETQSGILLVPLTDTPMTENLQQELREWQNLAATAWDMFPYASQTAKNVGGASLPIRVQQAPEQQEDWHVQPRNEG
jgi:hypothetical protein